MDKFKTLLRNAKLKETSLNHALLQEVVPNHPPEISVKPSTGEIEIILAIAQQNTLFNCDIFYTLGSRKVGTPEITIAAWGDLPANSPEDIAYANNFLAGLPERSGVAPLDCFNWEYRRFKAKGFKFRYIKTGGSNPKHKQFALLIGGIQETEVPNNSALKFFFENKNSISFSSLVDPTDFWSFLQREPRPMRWEHERDKEYRVETSLDILGRYFAKGLEEEENQKPEPLEKAEELDQPYYSQLPKLRYIFFIERNFEKKTHITGLKEVEGDKIQIIQGTFFPRPEKEITIGWWLASKIRDLVADHKKDLNLEAQESIKAVFAGKEILIYTSDATFDNLISFEEEGQEDKELKKFVEGKRLAIQTINTESEDFDYRVGLSQLKRAIAEELIDIDKDSHKMEGIYNLSSFEGADPELRALIILFASLNQK